MATRGTEAAVPSVRFVPVAVAGAPSVDVAVDPEAGDPVAAWFCDHGWIDEPVQRAFLELVRPGHKVLDLGCHLGTFSLPAAALGAEVLGVDANAEHTRLLSAAAARNGFTTLRTANVAVADRRPGDAEEVRFVPRSIHGRVLPTGEVADGALPVPARRVDDLLAELGWGHLDVVKMDVEGCEVAALRGMQELFATGCRPAMVLESNGPMLALQGSSVPALRQLLDDVGYRLYLIDHLRPGVLVRVGVDDVQTEAASDLLAVVDLPSGIGARWQIEPGMTRRRTVARVVDAAASAAAGYRRYAAGLLRDGPWWLREAPAAGPALEALAHDATAEVRGGPGPSPGHDHADAAEPTAGVPEDPVVVWAEGLAVALPPRGLEPPPGAVAGDRAMVLRDLSFHVNRGEPVAVLVSAPGRGAAFLRALEGQAIVAEGTLTVRGSVASLRSTGLGLEPKLPVGDNVLAFGAFLGCHVAAVEARRQEVLAAAGLAHVADRALCEAGAEAAARLALAVALLCVRADVLLLDDRLPVGLGAFRAWLTARFAECCAAGTAVVQVATHPDGLLIDPSRALRVDEDRLVANGHAPSVLGELRLRRLGFRSDPGGWASLPDGTWPAETR